MQTSPFPKFYVRKTLEKGTSGIALVGESCLKQEHVVVERCVRNDRVSISHRHFAIDVSMSISLAEELSYSTPKPYTLNPKP